MRKDAKGRMSAGTIVMLSLTLIVLAGFLFLWFYLSAGNSSELNGIRPEYTDPPLYTDIPEKLPETSFPESSPAPTTAPAAAETPVPEDSRKTFTLTAAGTVALEGEIRKNSYYSEAKQYDYYDIMMLLKKELQSDLNIVFLENLLTDEGKTNDVTASGAGAAMLKAAGFNTAACGFSKAWDKQEDGIAATGKLLEENGIHPVGISTKEHPDPGRTAEFNGIRVALLQYTDTIPAAARKKMVKSGQENLIPEADPERIAADTEKARRQGCELVIVLLNWGKPGKAPDKNMRAKAQQIADAGADLIIGCGSRIVSGADMLTSGDGKRQVLCVWSLGTVLGGNRSSISRIAGMLLQVTVCQENGKTEIRDACYIPVYTWKYRQDSRYYYRCLAADREVPDGMDAEQQKMMKKAADTVRKAMKDSPLGERKHE